MINICFVVDAPYAGGAERYVELLASALDRDRFRASLMVKRTPGLTEWTRGMREQDIDVLEAEMNLPFRPEQAPRIIESIRSLQPHIVHVNMPGPYDAQMGLMVPLSRLAGASRVVVTEHLPMVEKLLKRALLKKFSYRWIDAMVTVCAANVPYLVDRQEVPAGKVSVVHNALPAGYGGGRQAHRAKVRDELGISGNTVAVCITGSLIRRKGHHLLIDALSALEGLPWHLVIIGDGDERRACERLLDERDMRERTIMLGRRSTAEVERFLSGMDLFVLPSMMEAFPYTILEAMACGLPVVASRIYGIPEAAIDGETALLVESGSRGALAGALERLVRDPDLRVRFGQAGRARFERLFTLDAQINRMQSLYLDMLYQ